MKKQATMQSACFFFVETVENNHILPQKVWQNDYITRLIPLYNSFFSVFLPLIFCLY